MVDVTEGVGGKEGEKGDGEAIEEDGGVGVEKGRGGRSRGGG